VLAAAGYHVVAPDQRGYGRSSVPSEVTDYGIRQLTGDLIALADHYGKDDAVFVGHDWGALIVWELGRLYPQRARAIISVSVPAIEWLAPPTDVFKAVYQDNFFYMLYFQAVGPAEAELGADIRRSVATVFWGASGEGWRPSGPVPKEGNGFMSQMPEPPALPWAWFTEADLDYFTDHFQRSGFFGPVSYYRNMDANYGVMRGKGLDLLTMPTAFIAGKQDPVLLMDSGGVERMQQSLPNFLGATIIDGAGHWTQQERPDEFNQALLALLARL